MSNISWWEKILEAIKGFKDWFKPRPRPEPDITAEEKQRGFVWANLKWIYGDWTGDVKTKATLKMKECRIQGDVVRLVFDSPGDKWAGNNNPQGAGCSGGCCMFARQADGSWAGGRFDDIGAWDGIDTGRPMHHIWDQENVPDYPRRWRKPAVGTPVAFLVVSFDGSVHVYGKERTSAGFDTWQK